MLGRSVVVRGARRGRRRGGERGVRGRRGAQSALKRRSCGRWCAAASAPRSPLGVRAVCADRSRSCARIFAFCAGQAAAAPAARDEHTQRAAATSGGCGGCMEAALDGALAAQSSEDKACLRYAAQHPHRACGEVFGEPRCRALAMFNEACDRSRGRGAPAPQDASQPRGDPHAARIHAGAACA
jgi:hypothetical protein